MGKESTSNKISVGGQALIEGVMMNGPDGVALSVRHTDGNIITEEFTAKHIKDKCKIFGFPFIRGIVNFIESMLIGYKSLMRSAELSGQLDAEEDEEKMSKLDKWLSAHLSPKVVTAVTGVMSVIVAAVFLVADRKALKETDFMLLLTFVCFFVISENLGRVEAVREFLQSLLLRNTLLTSVGASQIISNVPAAVLLSSFTEDWKSLLQGVNIGGLGTPVASLASLITIKLYMKTKNSETGKFLIHFTLVNIIGLTFLLIFA